MNCPHFEQVAEAYLSGEIESPHWRTHLQNCLECAAKLRAELNFDLVIKHAVSEERLQTRQLESHIRSTDPQILAVALRIRARLDKELASNAIG